MSHRDEESIFAGAGSFLKGALVIAREGMYDGDSDFGVMNIVMSG